MMRQHFMYPYHWIILVIALVLLILAVVYLTRWYAGRSGDARETPLDILKERYARGEISREDFERMKKDIE